MLQWGVIPAPKARTATPVVLVAHPSADLYGSDRMLIESVAGMVAQGWRVVVTVPAPGPLVPELERVGAEIAFCPAPVLRKQALRPRGFLALVGSALSALPAAWRLVRSTRADVVYVNTLTVPLWLLVARLARRPAVCHVHEAEGSAPALVRRALVLPLLLARALMVNSRYTLGVLTGALPRLERRATVVYNGVGGPAAPVPPRAALQGALRLAYVGRISPRKGVAVAVTALRELLGRGVDARLDLVGAVFPGYEWFEAELRAAVADGAMDDKVTFRGFTSDPWALVSEADVLLVPSLLDEPFGNTAVEAGLAQRPVVVSDTSGLREAAHGLRSAVLVPPGDARALADAVASIAADWSSYRGLAVADAPALARRHDVARYRGEVVGVVAALVPGATSTPAGELAGA